MENTELYVYKVHISGDTVPFPKTFKSFIFLVYMFMLSNMNLYANHSNSCQHRSMSVTSRLLMLTMYK